MQTLSQRWSMLEPGAIFVGPDDDRPRPTVILFHGCGGLRGHLPRYAEAAKAAGWRAVIVDSYAPRGWSRQFAMAAVCTGLLLRGWERAGDVLAALWGVSRRPDVDAAKIVLAGWSHGGWGIMEAMSSARAPGMLGVADPGAVALDGVIGAWLAYPYVGVAALNRMRPWRHCPKTLAVISRRDHLTSVRNAERVHDMVRQCGAEVETWIAEGSHAFDEPMAAGPMRYHPELAAEAERRFVALLGDVAAAPAAAKAGR
ncbi:dienelactone hydrolase family protein [Brevundimonas sp.]|uniref:dienelactone hydrolase family protein n=1 Tax=Brevundimonas sp. TaxID=1871086 RepID=UPI002737C3D0|nr:dienelactone hydrolase [Brevundimonas sp.]MDP3802204.1 dienelactone hydrolase [Brevundimonas sp.]